MRTVCGFVGGTYAEELPPEDIFPVGAVTFSFRKSDTLTHRDILGALMSLEIKRELLGDILTAEGYAVVFVHENAIELVSSVDKIGRGSPRKSASQSRCRSRKSSGRSLRFRRSGWIASSAPP